MPKAMSSMSYAASGLNSPMTVLKRNQACHQCRRRKLKCDAKRPCSTCVRSHRNTVNHAPPGAPIVPLECTFDEVAENGAQASAAPKNRYERLENRISELEALLRQKEASNAPSPEATPIALPSQSVHSTPPTISQSSSPLLFSTTQSNAHILGSFSMPSNTDPSTISSQLPNGFSAGSPTIPAHITPVRTPPIGGSTEISSPELDGPSQVMFGNWPKNLPSPELLQHLVEVFFAYHPHAGKMFHGPTFIASLLLPPTHPNFPHTAILHAICAVGSCYTSVIPAAPLPDFREAPADDLFQTAYKRKKRLPDSFGEKHAKWCKLCIDDSTSVGDRLFDCQQAATVLTWYFHCHAKWAEMFLAAGFAMRYCVPLGLNMCPPFHSISKSLRAPSIIPPARTVIEDETRRNTFWLTYATERLYSAGNGWAMSMDDQDVSQLLPVRADQFDQGILVPPKLRQWAHSPDLLTNHPPEATDSFVLYIKGSMLLSRVRVFNLRFRAKNFAGDPTMVPPPVPGKVAETNAQYIDPRKTAGFKEIDILVTEFMENFPRGLRDPVRDNTVDIHLLLACLIPHVAKIQLHDPHADVRRTGCISAQKILEAARGILTHLYTIWSTSFDLSLLDYFCNLSFFLSGRVFVRFVQAAMEADDQTQLIAYRTELEFIRMALSRIGQRIELAYRYAKMLDDIIFQTVGVLDAMSLPDFPMPPMTEGMNFPVAMTAQDSHGGQSSLDILLSQSRQASLSGVINEVDGQI